MARDPSLFVGPIAFMLGMVVALLLLGWVGSVVSLAVLGIGAYVVLIVAMPLGGLFAYAAATAASRRLVRGRAGRHD